MSNQIPDRLNVYRRPKQTIVSAVCGQTEVYPAFAVPSDNPKRNETARDWAGNKSGPTYMPNSGFEIRIIDLESRDEGGRAYKVVDQTDNMFDLRERVVIDIIRRKGILAGGKVPGTFKWVVDGSQMLLVPDDSEWVSKAERASTKQPIKKLVPLQLYSDKRESKFNLYLGEGKCLLVFNQWWRDLPEYQKNQFFGARLYDGELPKTLYEAEMPIDLGLDVATGLIHGLVNANQNPTRRYLNYVDLREIARIVDRLDLCNDLLANPLKAQPPRSKS